MKCAMAAAIGLAVALMASAQTPAEPEFEVASVKPATGKAAEMAAKISPMFTNAANWGIKGGPGSKDPGRIEYSAVTLKALLARAYDFKPFEVFGPGWMDSERYDIVAKLPPDTDQERLRAMLRKLLTERFAISLHRETRELPGYTLVVAKGGHKLQPPEEEKKLSEEERLAAMAKRQEALLAEMKRDGATSRSRMWESSGSMAKLAERLSTVLGQRVTDQTGLEGNYSYSLSYVPEQGLLGSSGSGVLPEASNGPSIFTALQEQLGLKLVVGKVSREVLVVDKAERVPAEN